VGSVTFQTRFQPHLVWTLEQIKKNIEDKTHQHLDARSQARFDGVAPEPRRYKKWTCTWKQMHSFQPGESFSKYFNIDVFLVFKCQSTVIYIVSG
ncbi:hypothetical protein Leryth_015006, partial [Lithospermum erythrorhizon]